MKLRFSLRAMLLVMVGVAIVAWSIAVPLQEVMRGRRYVFAVKRIEGMGGDYTQSGFETPDGYAIQNVDGVRLDGPSVSDDTVTEMAPYLWDVRARWLSFEQSRITNASLPFVAEHKDMLWLSFGGCAIDDQGVILLRDLKRLRYLNLTGTQVTPAGAARLQSLLPGCDVVLNGPLTTRGTGAGTKWNRAYIRKHQQPEREIE